MLRCERNSDHRRAVYNSRNLQMLPSSRVRWFAVFTSFAFRNWPLATDWQTPITQLAGKIAAATGPGVVALDITNRSSVSAAGCGSDSPRVHQLELATAGVRVWQPEQAAATVKVTLSENLQNYVWVAEIQARSKRAIHI